ncbi:MAG: Gfo/Idh/MocA family oxidoreductase [Oscillospiraceae bacterium]|nr:Gfo/Idh/MocA family oxidoreductase [Oscillospiraceae bacterium]
MLNVAMLSKWHVHAGGYANEVKKLGHNIPVVWDEDENRGKDWAKELGCDYENDLAKVLARSDIDAVVVDTETSKHRDVMIAAANAKKHIFTEKTLAATKKEALEIAKAVEKNKVIFTISMPQRTSPVVLYAKQIIESGVLGQVNTARFRNAHNGASGDWLPDYWYIEKDACGGAMMDLGCHPMYVANYLLGDPARITSMYNATQKKSIDYGIEDNAINLIEFKNKAIAMVETSFVTPVSPWAFEIYGTEGMFLGSDNNIRLSTPETRKLRDGFIEVTKLPKSLPSPMQTWFNAIEKGDSVVFDIKAGIGLSELLENAYISHKTGTTVTIK